MKDYTLIKKMKLFNFLQVNNFFKNPDSVALEEVKSIMIESSLSEMIIPIRAKIEYNKVFNKDARRSILLEEKLSKLFPVKDYPELWI